MRFTFASLFFALTPIPASACLPPPPGTVEKPPTLEEKAQAIFNGSDTIVYGVVTRGTGFDRKGVLRVIHVYKGTARVGQRVPISASWGFDPPMCASMLGSPPTVDKGEYGVFAWYGEPALAYVSEERISAMFKAGLITPTKRSQAK